MATTFHVFRRTVTTSGTPVQLDTLSVEPDQTVLIKAKSTNAGVISVGNSSVEAIKTNDENYLLEAGQSVALKVPNTNEIWIDSTISGDIVEVVVGGGRGSDGERVSLITAIAGEDLPNDVLKVEQRYTPLKVTADTLVKTGAGFLHTLTFSCNDAAPTAGSIIVYDNTAESGTEIFNHTFTTTPFVPFSVIIDGSFTAGLYIGFTTTNDVNVTVSYR
jgi:hypothetical protein